MYLTGGISRTITYLQHLGADFVDLILEFSTWVLDQDGQEGLTIFTEDIPEVDSLPRGKVWQCTFLFCTIMPPFKNLIFYAISSTQVLQHLEQMSDPSLPIAYLEHLIHDSRIGETDPVFHNALIKLYLGRVRDLYADYLMTLPPGKKRGGGIGRCDRDRRLQTGFVSCYRLPSWMSLME